MEYLAHSGKDGHPAQSYISHIGNVLHRAQQYAEEAGVFSPKAYATLCATVRNSALLHDLGKLAEENQAVLRGKKKAAHLPINHVDAGVAKLLKDGDLYAALNVFSHHRGLPDMVEEASRKEPCAGDKRWGIRKELFLRDDCTGIRSEVDASLEMLFAQHTAIVHEKLADCAGAYGGNREVLFRMALSCLADADHSDTALHYGQEPCKEPLPQLRAAERLAALEQYVASLGSPEDARSQLRSAMFAACRDSDTAEHFTACDSPVGSGKTTAIMAHLLQQANKRGSRRAFVVLPYTSIITQAVEVYRKALVLPGEKPEEVVAELHCRADFEDETIRHLTALWRAPIVVTTAVGFFETLAANKPSSLRRLHELPGSVLFIDESHNALPIRLLPLAWHWMNALAEEWNCYWTLASGSLVRFWQQDKLPNLPIQQAKVHELVEPSLREALLRYEDGRICFRWERKPLSRSQLLALVQSLPGPRLLIMNTVQNAAVLANDLCLLHGRDCVEHLSTALCARDREATINRVKERLAHKEDTNWTLVATSCVEAGVDFSFRTGLREISSLLSLLQASGRVNRHGLHKSAEMWSFSMQDDSMLKPNASLAASTEVLKDYFRENKVITPELCTDALKRELVRNNSCKKEIHTIMMSEENQMFPVVADKFKAIDSRTVTAVIDDALCAQIKGRHGSWQLLQKLSVSIRETQSSKWMLEEIAPELYRWTLPYDSFLGYMRGVLDMEIAKKDVLIY